MKFIVISFFATLSIGCLAPPKTAEEACRRQASAQQFGRAIGRNNNAYVDYLENSRCDEIGKTEREIAANNAEINRIESQQAAAKQAQEQEYTRIRALENIVEEHAASICVSKDSTYENTYTYLNGNCGELTNDLVYVSATGMLQGSRGCVRNPGAYTNVCNIHTDFTCYHDGSATYASIGDFVYEKDGSIGYGIMSIATPTCRGSYRVNSKRLPIH